VPHPGNVVTLVSTSHDTSFDSFSHLEYLDIRNHTKSYDGVIANAPGLSASAPSSGPRRSSGAESWSPVITSARSAWASGGARFPGR
jgi:hypothetical protein